MKCKVIALAGVYDSGKTTVLHEMIAKLKQQNATVIANKTQVSSSYSGNDRREVLCWAANNGNKYRIGICTGGDLESIIDDNFSFFAGNQCNVCMTACRATASSDTVTAVIRNAAAKFGQQPYFVAKMKTAVANQRKVDTQTVGQLFDMIS